MQGGNEDLFERWRDGHDAAALAALFDRRRELWRVALHLNEAASESAHTIAGLAASTSTR